MTLYNLLKKNIIQDEKVAKFVLNQISAYQDNLRDDGLVESPDYEDWEFIYNYVEGIKSFPHTKWTFILMLLFNAPRSFLIIPNSSSK